MPFLHLVPVGMIRLGELRFEYDLQFLFLHCGRTQVTVVALVALDVVVELVWCLWKNARFYQSENDEICERGQ